MKKIKLHRRVTIFDITPPWPVSENRYNLWIAELKKHSEITDTTVCGEFVYPRSTARNLRIEVDSRFITDERLFEILTEIFTTITKATRRYQEYAH